MALELPSLEMREIQRRIARGLPVPRAQDYLDMMNPITKDTPITNDFYERMREFARSQPPTNFDFRLSKTKVYEDLTERDEPQQRRPNVVSTCYGVLGLSPAELRIAVDQVAEDLRKLMQRQEADAYVVRGASGVVFGGALLYAAPDLKCIVARKPGEHSHAGTLCSVSGGNLLEVRKFVVVDDFRSSGSTVQGMVRDMQPAEHVGMLFYQEAQRRGPDSNH